MKDSEKFAEAVKRQIREAVGAYCSAPHCGIQTGGYDRARDKAFYTGDAAHIFGAKESAARYDGLPENWGRHSFQNGIWLCAVCHRQVDQAPNMFPGSTLVSWKLDAEQRYSAGYLRRENVRYGTDMHLELQRAYGFLALLRPAISSFLQCFQSANQYNYIQAFSDEAARILSNLVRPSITSPGWSNRHPCWTFIQDFQLWQTEMVRMAALLLRHPEFGTLAERTVDWRTWTNRDGEIEYATGVAEDIHAFTQQFFRFEDFLRNYQGPKPF